MAAELGVAAFVDEAGAQRGGDIGDAAEVGVVPAPLAAEQPVQRMVEIVVPLRLEPIAAERARAAEARIVEVALGDQYELAAELALQGFDLQGELLEEVHRRLVEERVH